MLAHISPQNAPLLEGFYEKMWLMPATVENVIADLEDYTCGSELTIVSVDGQQERTVEIEFLQDLMMVEGDHRLKLHVNDNGNRFMCFVYMNDVRMGKAQIRVTMRSCFYERLFGTPDLLVSDAAAMATVVR